jgi:hypothetical protein
LSAHYDVLKPPREAHDDSEKVLRAGRIALHGCLPFFLRRLRQPPSATPQRYVVAHDFLGRRLVIIAVAAVFATAVDFAVAVFAAVVVIIVVVAIVVVVVVVVTTF